MDIKGYCTEWCQIILITILAIRYSVFFYLNVNIYIVGNRRSWREIETLWAEVAHTPVTSTAHFYSTDCTVLWSIQPILKTLPCYLRLYSAVFQFYFTLWDTEGQFPGASSYLKNFEKHWGNVKVHEPTFPCSLINFM